MLKGLVATAAFVALSLIGSSAFAQAVGEVQTVGGQRNQEFHFDDELVSGQLVRPDGESTRVRRRSSVVSLIHIREHFVDEMLKSVENL